MTANLDYIIDGVCKQLRNLDAHPQAPALLAALMQESGAPGEGKGRYQGGYQVLPGGGSSGQLGLMTGELMPPES